MGRETWTKNQNLIHPQNTLCRLKHLFSATTKIAIHYLPEYQHNLPIMIHTQFMRLTLFLLTELPSSLFFSKFLASSYCWFTLSKVCCVEFSLRYVRLLSVVTFFMSIWVWQISNYSRGVHHQPLGSPTSPV